jgi:hypothetical protein
MPSETLPIVCGELSDAASSSVTSKLGPTEPPPDPVEDIVSLRLDCVRFADCTTLPARLADESPLLPPFDLEMDIFLNCDMRAVSCSSGLNVCHVCWPGDDWRCGS